MQSEPSSLGASLLAAIMSDETFRPAEPVTLSETGLPSSLIESLVLKRLVVVGQSSGRQLSNDLALPFAVLEEMFQMLRARQIIVHKGSAPLNDYYYMLTDTGRERAQNYMRICAYVGPAPVPLMDYIVSAEAQTIRAESPRASQLKRAFSEISVNEEMFEALGPAINSGAGLFLYGEPGNGKSTLAKRITQCFGQEIWIPQTIYEDGQIIKLYDAAYHRIVEDDHEQTLGLVSHDRRWIKVRRPTVVVGGELTLDSLEIRFDANSRTSEAPLQMKSNGGCLLIDDFGRQRIEPRELLNRWIIPLETRIDYLTLSTGKKIQVPFEQLIIFSTNLEPADLVDEAFLRRIPYKIEVSDPDPAEFHRLCQFYCQQLGFTYDPLVIQNLVQRHYLSVGRRMRRCHPRDLMLQIRNWCTYNERPMELKDEYFDRVVRSYFTCVLRDGKSPAARAPSSTTPAAADAVREPAG